MIVELRKRTPHQKRMESVKTAQNLSLSNDLFGCNLLALNLHLLITEAETATISQSDFNLARMTVSKPIFRLLCFEKIK